MPIACFTIPRFAVEAERRRRSDIASRLIIIGDAAVLDCSLGVEASAVRRGMRMSEAIGTCPRAVVLPTDRPYYEQQFEQVLDCLQEFSPEVEGADSTAYISLKGLPGVPVALAEEIISKLQLRLGYLATAGIAAGKFVARTAATTTAPGRIKRIVIGEESVFLAPLPVDHLPLQPSTLWRLKLLGLETIGSISELPLGAVQAQFGPEGKTCWDLANGIDNEPILPRAPQETVLRRLELPSPAVTLEIVLAALQQLVLEAFASLAGHRRIRKAALRAALSDGGSWELLVPFREAFAGPGDAWFAIKNAVSRRPPDRPVEELAVELIGLSFESGKQSTMFEGKAHLWLQVEEAVKQLRAQPDSTAIGKIVPLDPGSRIPERRAALLELDP